MNEPSKSTERQAPHGCAFALAVGLLTIASGTGAFSLMTGRPVNLHDEWGVFLLQAFIVATPFGLLALIGCRPKAPWFVGFVLTAAIWGYYYFDGIRYQLSGDKSGADIGLGLLMLASPVIISAACLLSYAQQRWRL